ncbi:MAG: hypothetical protein MUD04_10450 [Cyanobium sp. Prado107]|nr:hypothetical protein [Cyanobium sp. Prado107]
MSLAHRFDDKHAEEGRRDQDDEAIRMMTRDEVDVAIDWNAAAGWTPGLKWRFGYTNELFADRSEPAGGLILVLSLTAVDRRPTLLHGG